MAKLYRRAGGRVGFRRTEAEEASSPIPVDAAAIVEFDEETNVSLCDEIQADTARFNVSAGAVTRDGQAVATATDGDRKSLRKAATAAVADNNTFLALASPSNAQTLAQVKELTRQSNRVIKSLVKLLEAN